jgi:ABC-type Na+ efflux pump permease subunit
MRFGPGPVFGVEMVAAARRWQTYALRAGLVLFLFITLAIVWANDSRVRSDGSVSLNQYAELGASFATGILSTQLALVLLAAPAATAGAICIDKARGNLTLLMATDLSTREIVVGKLLARLIPVFGLIATSVPVLFIASLLGGISGELLVGGFMVLIGTAIGCCALALVLSVYVGKTHEALLLAYFAILFWLLTYPILSVTVSFPLPDWLLYLNPFALMYAPLSPIARATSWEYVQYLLVALGIAAISLGWIICRFRRILLHPTVRRAKTASEPRLRRNRRLHWLDRQPIVWYERHRKRLTRAGRLIWFIFIASSSAGTLWVAMNSSNRINQEWAIMTNLLIVAVGLLLATIGAVTVLADERTRGNLDILLTTPLATREIVWAKWRSAFAVVPKVLLLPALAGLILFILHLDQAGFFSRHCEPQLRMMAWAATVTLWFAFGVFTTSVGLGIATYVPQLGRAVGLAVTVYVAVAIGWMFFIMAVSSREDSALMFVSASPVFAAAFGTISLMGHESDDSVTAFCIGALIWSVLYLLTAIAIYAKTQRIFDRKLGRITLKRSPPARQ